MFVSACLTCSSFTHMLTPYQKCVFEYLVFDSAHVLEKSLQLMEDHLYIIGYKTGTMQLNVVYIYKLTITGTRELQRVIYF